MTISVDWSVRPFLITIPQSDLTLVSGTKYQITVNFLWKLLREFADDSTGGAPEINTYRRTAATASTPAITEINDPIYVAQFENGNYSVDIINGNTNWQEVEVKNNVSVGTNNTTGFINPEFLELGLFSGQVCIDALNVTGNAALGTDKTPQGAIIGTRQAPCLDFEQAKTIAVTRGINQFNLMSNLLLAGADFSAGYTWTADRRQITLNVEPAADVTGNSMRDMTVIGELDGLNSIERCDILAVTNISGNIFQCNLGSTIGITGETQIDQCFSGVAGAGYPTVNNGGSHELIVRDMRGSLGLANFTGGIHSIGLYGGRLVLENTCTGGEIHARGDPFEIVNNGTATLVDETGEAQLQEIYTRLDLDPNKPNTYTNDGSNIVNADFTLTKTDTGNVSIVQRS